jgi:hypothetical protein
MRTLLGILLHERLFFDNTKSFRAQNERAFATGHRTRSRSPCVSALAVCADQSPASTKKWGDTPNFSWRLREFNDLRRSPVVFAKSSRFLARSQFDTRNIGTFARVTMSRHWHRSHQEFLATLRTDHATSEPTRVCVQNRIARLLGVFAPLRLCALNRARPHCDQRLSPESGTQKPTRDSSLQNPDPRCKTGAGGKMNPYFAAVTFDPRPQITPTSQSPCCKTLPFRLTFPQRADPHRNSGRTRAQPRSLQSTSALLPQSAVNNLLAQSRKGAKNAKPVFFASLPLCVFAR